MHSLTDAHGRTIFVGLDQRSDLIRITYQRPGGPHQHVATLTHEQAFTLIQLLDNVTVDLFHRIPQPVFGSA